MDELDETLRAWALEACARGGLAVDLDENSD